MSREYAQPMLNPHLPQKDPSAPTFRQLGESQLKSIASERSARMVQMVAQCFSRLGWNFFLGGGWDGWNLLGTGKDAATAASTAQ